MKIVWSITFVVLLLALSITTSAQESGIVFGQADFSQGAANRGGAVDAGTLNYPLGILVDAAGGLYIADRNNHRVLYFADDGDTTADRVWGQHGSFTTGMPNNDGSGSSGAPSEHNLFLPQGLALDGSGRLFVTDTGNNQSVADLDASGIGPNCGDTQVAVVDLPPPL